VAATIEMGRALGMTVVAEGVETSQQLDVLKRLGCDYIQGFLFARPEPEGQVCRSHPHRLRGRPQGGRPGWRR